MKYSILIPTYNAGTYLKECIDTIIQQNYEDYELLISDDHSTDGTNEYIGTLKHPRIKAFWAPYEMSMSEHWEWLLSHAQGEWIIFVGQDDGLQPYFFDLAERLINIAEKQNIRTIQSKRAYFFWPGCEGVYGFRNVLAYDAASRIEKRSSFLAACHVLGGFHQYFELPIMYTSSVFHKSILEEARALQNGKVFVTHPQDANLAALACSLDRHFIYSGIPLGWEGASIKSAGMAVAEDSDLNLKKKYKEKVMRSPLPYSKFVGDFNFSSMELYFWGALLETSSLRSKFLNRILLSKFLKYIIFCVVIDEKKFDFNNSMNPMFLEILHDNNCSLKVLRIVYALYQRRFAKAYRKLLQIHSKFFQRKYPEIKIALAKGECSSVTQASKIVEAQDVKSKLIFGLK